MEKLSLGDARQLAARNLPNCQTAIEIAMEMGISLGKLKFLTLKQPIDPTIHYSYFQIPKSNGSSRQIAVPIPALKDAQAWIVDRILSKLEIHDAAHGFQSGRSIVTNARPHVAKRILIKADLQDFFPSIRYQKVRTLFSQIGYSQAATEIFALLCTHIDRDANSRSRRDRFWQSRHLPQGAKSSPILSNIICYDLDRDLMVIADRLGFEFTRYADDLTFSSNTKDRQLADEILQSIAAIVSREGFKLQTRKTQILSTGEQQLVTGIIVNQKLNIAKHKLNSFRATLHQIDRHGLSNKTWGNSTNTLAAIAGYANYVAMINPERGAKLRAKIDRLRSNNSSQT